MGPPIKAVCDTICPLLISLYKTFIAENIEKNYKDLVGLLPNFTAQTKNATSKSCTLNKIQLKKNFFFPIFRPKLKT